MMETLNKIKLAVVGIAGAITAVFGWMGWLVIGFAACMLLDWITGSVAGSKKDGWSSATARAGLWHKGGMLVVVVVAAALDGLLGIIINNDKINPMDVHEPQLLQVVMAYRLLIDRKSVV